MTQKKLKTSASYLANLSFKCLSHRQAPNLREQDGLCFEFYIYFKAVFIGLLQSRDTSIPSNTTTFKPLSKLFSYFASAYTTFPDPRSPQQLLSSKKAPALGAWVVSNCAASKRREIIDELSRDVTIDVFGKCSNLTLCRGNCMHEVLST